MFKKFLIILVLTLIAIPAMAQFKAYPASGIGYVFTKGNTTEFGTFGAIETNFGLPTVDTVKGFSVMSRTGYHYANTDTTLQALSEHIIVRKTLGLTPNVEFFAALGGGYTRQILTDKDQGYMSGIIEGGLHLYKQLDLTIGGEIIPQRNQVFVYTMFNFMGLLDKVPAK